MLLTLKRLKKIFYAFRKEHKKVSQEETLVLPSSNNAFTNFFKNNPQYISDAFIAIGEVDCFNAIEFITESETKLLTILTRELKEEYRVYPKIRLLEFVRPTGDDVAVKNLIYEIQNITCDFVISSASGSIVAVIQLNLDEPLSRFQEKKHLIIKRICNMINIPCIIIRAISEIMSDDTLNSLLKNEERS